MDLVWLVAAGDFAALLKELLFVSALGANTCLPTKALLYFATRFFEFIAQIFYDVFVYEELCLHST